jgi:hypothetical protein
MMGRTGSPSGRRKAAPKAQTCTLAVWAWSFGPHAPQHGHDLNHRGGYQAIRATLPEGADSWPAQPDGRGGVRIWLDREFVNRLGQMLGPGESYSDVISRLADAACDESR